MKMMKNLKKNKKGFTLVELIVVIVIILVLSAVMVPNVLKYIDKANVANCKADAAVLLSQIQVEVADILSELDESLIPDDIEHVLEDIDAEFDPNHCSLDTAETVKALYYVEPFSDHDQYGSVTHFAYADGKHFFTWNMEEGWSEVDENINDTTTPLP